ncbi:MAG: LapA family protein [Thermodesulfobacteriota bacterium]|nr:LapA family protein [Thermodesulfobacteriota bacterium]
MKPNLLILLVVIILFLIFLIQNTQVVTLQLYFWKISMSQIILIPLVLIVVFIVEYITARFKEKRSCCKMSTSMFCIIPGLLALMDLKSQRRQGILIRSFMSLLIICSHPYY